MFRNCRVYADKTKPYRQSVIISRTEATGKVVTKLERISTLLDREGFDFKKSELLRRFASLKTRAAARISKHVTASGLVLNGQGCLPWTPPELRKVSRAMHLRQPLTTTSRRSTTRR